METSHVRNRTVQIFVLLLLLPSLLAIPARPAEAAATAYPDLRTLPPADLRFDTVDINGSKRFVLRFSNLIWNAGEGPLDLRGVSDAGTDRTTVYQRLAAGDGVSSRRVGEFTYHDQHRHWHFEGFSDFQLWTKAQYDVRVASGGVRGRPLRTSPKTTSCVLDTTLVRRLPDTPSSAQFTRCGAARQGLSVGWADKYGWQLPGQWVDLGARRLADGVYALRSVADPDNRLFESAHRADPAREGAAANEAVTWFRVRGNAISYDRTPPVARPPAVRLVRGDVVHPSGVTARVVWGASDGLSGVSGYRLRQSTNGGAPFDVKLPTPATTHRSRVLAPGKRYDFLTRARDRAGNWGAWVRRARTEVGAAQEGHPNVAYGGEWSAFEVGGAWGGKLRVSGARGARARFRFSGAAVAWVGTRMPNRGMAEVWIDGQRAASVDLYAPDTLRRRMLYTASWPRAGAHTIEVRVLGRKHASATDTLVDVDGFVVLR